MNSRLLVIIVSVSIILALLLLFNSGEEKRPNIVFFYADDLGWKDLGVQGSDFYETPAIDKLASEGMRFTQAYSNAANCAPARASLMTGLYSPRHGIFTVAGSARGASENRRIIPIENTRVLDPSLETLPQALKKLGYNTCMAGKWHLSDDPTKYGFDQNFGGFSNGAPRSYFSPYDNPNLADGPEGEHLPERLSSDISKWIRENSEDPFFVYFPFYSVHTPIQAREDLTKKYEAKEPGDLHDHTQYASMIESMDQAIAKVLATLKELKLSENTIVIFSSDNGPYGPVSTVDPLRGAKGMFYEGGIRVPLIVKWPGQVRPGTTSNTPVIGTDLFPTLMDALKDTTRRKLDGESYLPVLKGTGKTKDRPLYWHFPAYLQMQKTDRTFDDSHDAPYWRSTPLGAIRYGDWKLIEYFETGEIELFNLRTDPGEQNDLSEAEPEKARDLMIMMTKWRNETGAPIPTEMNPDFVEDSVRVGG